MLPSKYLIIGLAIAVAGLGASNYVLSLKLDAANARVIAEKAGRKQDRDRYVAEQAEYKAKALEAKAKKELQDAKKAADADNRVNYWRSKFNDSLVRYNRATKGSVGSTNLPGTGAEAKGSDGPSGDSFIPITVNDANICAINTARLLSAHEWATKTE